MVTNFTFQIELIKTKNFKTILSFFQCSFNIGRSPIKHKKIQHQIKSEKEKKNQGCAHTDQKNIVSSFQILKKKNLHKKSYPHIGGGPGGGVLILKIYTKSHFYMWEGVAAYIYISYISGL
jgi:hypothetical protein